MKASTVAQAVIGDDAVMHLLLLEISTVSKQNVFG